MSTLESTLSPILARLSVPSTNGQDLAADCSAVAEAWVTAAIASAGGLPRGWAVVAQGGLARRQWLPGADVDLLFLRADALADASADVEVDGSVDMGNMVAALWDAGLKVSWAVRTVSELKALFDDVDGKQGHAAMALMEARALGGDVVWGKSVLVNTRRALGADRRRRLLSARLQEAARRRGRFFHSPSLVEPDPKEGPGGLRDAQLLAWAGLCRSGLDVGDGEALAQLLTAGTLLPSEVTAIGVARSELLLIRAALLASSGGGEHRLHAGAAEAAAELLPPPTQEGLRPGEDLVRRAVAAMRSCLVVVDDALDRLVPDLPPVFRVRSRYAPPQVRGARPIDLAAVLAQTEPTGVPGPLTALLERGVLGQRLPDIERLIGRVKHDGIHAFCTDAHLARCGDIALGVVGGAGADVLGDAALPPPLQAVLARIERPAVVVASALMHDIGKGLPGDHSMVGEEICRRELPALGFSDDDIDDICFVVLHHLLLSTTAQRSDLGDPRVIDNLTAIITSPARLDVLAIVTWCDWCAVAPGIGTAWKARLLADCVDAVREALLSPHLRARDAETVRARAKQSLAGLNLDADLVDRFVGDASVPWLRGRTPAALRDDARAFAVLSRGGAGAVVGETAPQRAWVLAADRRGLLADLAAAFASEGVSVLDARLDVRADGAAFDCFVFDDGRAGVVGSDGCRLLEVTLTDALGGVVRPISRRPPRSAVPARVRFLDAGDPNRVVVEVRGPDRRALLHDLARVFSEHDLSITLARLHTEGTRVTDVFTAVRPDGVDIGPEARLSLGQALQRLLTPD